MRYNPLGGNQPTIRMIQHTHTVNKISAPALARTSKTERESGQVRRGQERPDDWFPLAQTPTTFLEEANWLTKLAAAAFTLNRPSNRKKRSQKAPPVSLFATCCFRTETDLSVTRNFEPWSVPQCPWSNRRRRRRRRRGYRYRYNNPQRNIVEPLLMENKCCQLCLRLPRLSGPM